MSTKCQKQKERNYRDWRQTKERGGKEEKKSTKCQKQKERNYRDWRRTKERGGKEEKRRRNSSRR